MKKVLMVATVSSMIGQFNMSNIQILKDLGYEVHVACDFTDRSVWTEERVEKFKVQLKELYVKYFQVDFSRSPLKIQKHRKSYVELKQLFQKNEYCFVHCHTPIASVICRMVAHKMKVKCIYTAHGFHFFKGAPLKNWLIYYPVEKFFSRWTDILITINEEDYKIAKKKMYAKKVVLIPGVGVDTKKFADYAISSEEKRKELKLPESAFVLLSVSELSERKNQRVVLEALHKINNLNIYYLMVGTGQLKEEYEQLIQEYGLEKNVRLLGFRTDIGELCKIADCFIHLAKQEGLAIAPLEAMACGLPLISSEVRGVRDYTEDGKSGCCIQDYTSVEEIAKAIKKMQGDSKFREQCGLHNLEEVKKYNLTKIDEFMKETYEAELFGGGYKNLVQLIHRQKLRLSLGFALDDLVLISVGELNENKNHGVVIEALAELHNEKIKYVVCGQGNLKAAYEKRIQELGLEKQVKLLGFQADIKSYLEMSDVFVFPSKREGLAVAPLEAMACGLPLISSEIRGVKDYTQQNKTGYCLNDNSSVNEMGQAIQKMYLNREFRKQCGDYNLNYVKRYDVFKVSKNMQQLYLNLEG